MFCRGAQHLYFDHFGSSLAITRYGSGQTGADCRQGIPEIYIIRVPGFDSFIAGHAVGHDHRHIVRAAVAVNSDHIETESSGVLQRFPQTGGGHRRVGGYKAEHRRHVRVNHARPLGHAADSDLPAPQRQLYSSLLGEGIRGHDSPGRQGASIR
ncbi:MAG: hypothetical protein BWY65_02005 [Firmicutes bacterium ADurb.Bin373]|nr:MAG: hypothetical protein BWY65_02005 [Firmicutes bacterium ADurb.Bin373]